MSSASGCGCPLVAALFHSFVENWGFYSTGPMALAAGSSILGFVMGHLRGPSPDRSEGPSRARTPRQSQSQRSSAPVFPFDSAVYTKFGPLQKLRHIRFHTVTLGVRGNFVAEFDAESQTLMQVWAMQTQLQALGATNRP